MPEGSNQRAGAIVNKNMRDVVGQRPESVHYRILPFPASANERGWRRRVSGQFGHLPLVAIDHHVKVGDATGHEGRGAVCKNWASGEGSEHLVLDRPLHPGTVAGGEKNGGGAGHGIGD